MEKRALVAIALSALVLIAWYALVPQPERPHPQAPETQTAATPDTAPAPAPESPPPVHAAPAPPAEAIAAASQADVLVETDLFEIVLTNRGGRAASWKLKQYTSASGEPVELVPVFARRDGAFPLGIEVPGDERFTRAANESLYQVKRTPLDPETGRGERVELEWADGRGRHVRKTLSFRKDSYLVDVEIVVADRDRVVPARLAWGPGLEANDSVAGGYLHYTGQAVQRSGGVVTRLSRQKASAEATVPLGDQLTWAGLEEQYFAALILPAGSRGDVAIRSAKVVTTDPKKPEPEVTVAVGLPEGKAQLFVGPKKFTLLRDLGHELDTVVWFSSWSLIALMAKMLLQALLFIHDHVVSNYGLAIILATIALRLLLFPLNQYSMVSMKKVQGQMQRIQPKVNAIKTKYRKNKDAESRQRMNEEMMALYRKEGVNPMGGMSGCLPLLIQFPILIGFYNMLTVATELRGAPFFGWIQDLTLKDPFYVTPLLMGVTMFAQQKMTTTPVGDPAQRRLMLMMPIVFTVMFLNLPSGLVLYWFVNNLLGIGQQWLVNRHIGRVEAAAQKA
jgi:YidC/Oxa1 family membrane protein insertase